MHTKIEEYLAIFATYLVVENTEEIRYPGSDEHIDATLARGKVLES